VGTVWNCDTSFATSTASSSCLVQVVAIVMSTVACGVNHAIVLSEEDECFVWGWNGVGQLGLGDRKDRQVPPLLDPPSGVPFAMLAAGDNSTIAHDNDGRC